VSPAADPVAVTVFAVPPLLNVKPFVLLAVNVQDPPPPLAVIVHRPVVPIFTEIVESVEANPEAVTVTVTPLGPETGLSVSTRGVIW
jgi:hypothetical protein